MDIATTAQAWGSGLGPTSWLHNICMVCCLNGQPLWAPVFCSGKIPGLGRWHDVMECLCLAGFILLNTKHWPFPPIGDVHPIGSCWSLWIGVHLGEKCHLDQCLKIISVWPLPQICYGLMREHHLLLPERLCPVWWHLLTTNPIWVQRSTLFLVHSSICFVFVYYTNSHWGGVC